MKSVIFIHAIGIDEYGDHVTRGMFYNIMFYFIL